MRRLWLEVLLIGLTDAARGKDSGWLWSMDFALVCELAQVSPDQVRRHFQIRQAELANIARRSGGTKTTMRRRR